VVNTGYWYCSVSVYKMKSIHNILKRQFALGSRDFQICAYGLRFFGQFTPRCLLLRTMYCVYLALNLRDVIFYKINSCNYLVRLLWL